MKCQKRPASPCIAFFVPSALWAGGQRGMTLMEVLIALTILVGVTVSSLSFMNRKENHIKKLSRQWKALNRQLDYQSRLHGQVWRWVIDLDKNTYWVEKQVTKGDSQSLDSKALETNKEGDSSFKELALKARLEGFILDKNFFKKPQVLPKSFTFESMETSHQQKPLTSGPAYIYYLPEGQFSKVLLIIKHKKSYRSLFFNRLNGEGVFFSGKKNLKDLES